MIYDSIAVGSNIPKDTEYLGERSMDAAGIQHSSIKYLQKIKDTLFLKQYCSDILDHHLITVANECDQD